jgi:carbon monoxide dehydrogenase subunit G
MDMTGEYSIAAPRQNVWEELNDPEVLKQCIPGCEEMQKISPTEFTAKVNVKVGPISARFGGKVQLLDLDPPNGCRINGEGSGGIAGFAKGGATVKLVDVPGGTKLSYSMEAHVGGKLAQIGSRLIDATARKYAEEFFSRFVAIVEQGHAARPVSQPTGPAATAPTPTSLLLAALPSAGRRSAPALWVSILLLVPLVAVLYFFTR